MLRLLIPLLVAHLVVRREMCPKDMTQTKQPIKNQIREMMWPVLLIALGFAWYLTGRGKLSLMTDGAYVLTTGLISWWLHVHLCKDSPEQANIILFPIAAATTWLVYLAGRTNILASMTLMLVLIWLLFAEQLRIPKLHFKLPSVSIKLPQLVVTPGSVNTTDNLPVEISGEAPISIKQQT